MTDPPLLALAAGKKIRLRKCAEPPQKELSLHISVAQLLKVAGSPEWRWTHIPSGELRDARTAAKLKAMGVQPGWPDFIFVGSGIEVKALYSAEYVSRARLAFLELKRKGKRLSDSQKVFRDWCVERNIPFEVADNLQDAIRFLSQLGIIKIMR